MVIGIIGKVGSGKTEVTRYIADNYGFITHICDDIAKEMMNIGDIGYKMSSADEFFINENIQEDVRINVHTKVFSRIYENIDKLKYKYNAENHVIETALPNDGFMVYCDKTIYVENSLEKKKELLTRDRNYDDERIQNVLESQEYYEKFYSKADYTIKNDGTLDDLYKKVKEVMDEIYIPG